MAGACKAVAVAVAHPGVQAKHVCHLDNGVGRSPAVAAAKHHHIGEGAVIDVIFPVGDKFGNDLRLFLGGHILADIRVKIGTRRVFCVDFRVIHDMHRGIIGVSVRHYRNRLVANAVFSGNAVRRLSLQRTVIAPAAVPVDVDDLWRNRGSLHLQIAAAYRVAVYLGSALHRKGEGLRTVVRNRNSGTLGFIQRIERHFCRVERLFRSRRRKRHRAEQQTNRAQHRRDSADMLVWFHYNNLPVIL